GLSGNVDIARGAGFIDAELFSLMLPLLAIVLAIGSGARTLAGEEDAGRLELVLAYPLRHRGAVLAKGAAVGLELALFSVAADSALALASLVFGLGLPLGRLALGVLGIGLLALLHGCSHSPSAPPGPAGRSRSGFRPGSPPAPTGRRPARSGLLARSAPLR